MFGKLRIQHRIRKALRMFRGMASDPKFLYYLRHIDRNDQLKVSMDSIILYDRLDNHGMNCFMRKVGQLKKDDRFIVDSYFKIPNHRDRNYISFNMEGNSTFSIVNINIKESKWLNSISISGTYIDNSTVLLEACFSLKRIMSSYALMHEFVMDYDFNINNRMFYTLYRIEKYSYRDLLKQEEQLFYDIFQDLYCLLFYTQIGFMYALPMCIGNKVHKYNNRKARKLSKAFLCTVYNNGKDFLIIYNMEERCYYLYYYCGKRYKDLRLLHYFSEYSTEMYYRAFHKIEMYELEIKMRKYLNSRRNSVSSGDIKWLINKIRGIEEQEPRLKMILNNNPTNEKWSRYEKGTLINSDIVEDNRMSIKFKALYKQHLEYLQAISATRDNKLILFVTVATLIVTSVGVLLSVFK